MKIQEQYRVPQISVLSTLSTANYHLTFNSSEKWNDDALHFKIL